LKDTLANISGCVQNSPNPIVDCSLNAIALPQLLAKFPADAYKTISNRVHIWACQVNPLSKSLKNSVAVGTGSWSSTEDIINNMRVTSLLPCYSVGCTFLAFVFLIDKTYWDANASGLHGAAVVDKGHLSIYM
jgi:hypothetical protein